MSYCTTNSWLQGTVIACCNVWFHECFEWCLMFKNSVVNCFLCLKCACIFTCRPIRWKIEWHSLKSTVLWVYHWVIPLRFSKIDFWYTYFLILQNVDFIVCMNYCVTRYCLVGTRLLLFNVSYECMNESNRHSCSS